MSNISNISENASDTTSRGRVNNRTGRQRTVVFERSLSQAGAESKFLNKCQIKQKTPLSHRHLKTRLKETLISNAFYSTARVMSHK